MVVVVVVLPFWYWLTWVVSDKGLLNVCSVLRSVNQCLAVVACRTTHLLEDFCEGVEPQFFYSCLWECVLASPTNRLAAINYVLSHFSRKKSLEDQIYFVGSNVNLLVITAHV